MNSSDSTDQRSPGRRWTADLLLLTTALLWGANILVFKYSIRDLNPWVFNSVRLIFALITLGLLAAAESRFARRRDAKRKIPTGQVGASPDELAPSVPVPWRRVLLFSLLTGFIYLLVFVKGLDLTTAGNTALILASMPMWTAILSRFFLQERLPGVTWLGLVVTFIGTAIVTTQGSGEVSLASRYFTGNLLMLLAAMIWAVGTVLSRSILVAISPLRLAFISCLLTTPLHLLLAAPAIAASLPQLIEPANLIAIIYSGAFSTGVAYATWHAGVRAVGGSHAAVYQNVVTLVAVVGGWVMLHEPMLIAQIAGGLVTIAGLFLMRRGRK